MIEYVHKIKRGVGMFNSKFKKEAISGYKEVVEEYEQSREEILKGSENLYNSRILLKDYIELTLNLVNRLKNKPLEMTLKVEEAQLKFDKFKNTILELEKEIDTELKKNVLGAGAGVAAGGAVAAFGPSAAMAIATTFGTASTGTAISALSGAAATNAALAWLGGGALVAGGGGTAAGSTLLALAGPIGWAIGGTAVATAGILTSSKNKKVGKEALDKTAELHKAIRVADATKIEIKYTTDEVNRTAYLINTAVQTMDSNLEQYRFNFHKIVEANAKHILNDLGTLVNNMNSAIQLLTRPIGEQA